MRTRERSRPQLPGDPAGPARLPPVRGKAHTVEKAARSIQLDDRTGITLALELRLPYRRGTSLFYYFRESSRGAKNCADRGGFSLGCGRQPAL